MTYSKKYNLGQFQELSNQQLKKMQGSGKHSESLYGGALTGASIGTYFGPWGVLGGAAIGGAAGLIGSYL